MATTTASNTVAAKFSVLTGRQIVLEVAMNSKFKLLFLIGGLITGLLGFALARTFLFERAHIPHSLVLYDRSGSAQGTCGSVVSLSLNAMKLPQMQKGSTVTVVITGDELTANEPVTLGSYVVPISDKVFEGKDDAVQKQNEILAEINGRCSQFSAARKSPVFLAMKSSIEQLRSLGCDEKTGCVLFVKSDLQENAEPEIKAAVGGSRAALTKLPKPIDNRGISVRICGIAETQGLVKDKDGTSRQMTKNRSALASDIVRQVWVSLFIDPANVSFSSFCPGS